jgi:hypothetical protein
MKNTQVALLSATTGFHLLHRLDDLRLLRHLRRPRCPSEQRGSGGVRPLLLPARSPNLNAFAERWVRSIKSECLSKLILFGYGVSVCFLKDQPARCNPTAAGFQNTCNVRICGQHARMCSKVVADESVKRSSSAMLCAKRSQPDSQSPRSTRSLPNEWSRSSR